MAASESSSSSAQAARRSLADRLRRIRIESGLTARDLATSAGWHRTKVSKLEHAVTSPSTADIRTWCELCGANDQVPDLIAARAAAETMWTEWRRLERPGLRRVNESVVPLWDRTRRFRIYSSWLIPGPVQSEGYIRALLTATRERRGLVDDVEEATAVRVAKQHVVDHGDHRFAIVLEEAVLRYRIGGPEVLAGQLRYLLDVTAAPSVSISVIPMDAERRLLRPVEMFFLFDDDLVDAEFVSGRLQVTTPSEIAMYVQAFEMLSAMAVSGRAARALISSALQEL